MTLSHTATGYPTHTRSMTRENARNGQRRPAFEARVHESTWPNAQDPKRGYRACSSGKVDEPIGNGRDGSGVGNIRMGYASADGDHQSKAHGESNRAVEHILFYQLHSRLSKITENFRGFDYTPSVLFRGIMGRMKTIAIVTGASSGNGRANSPRSTRPNEPRISTRNGSSRAEATALDARSLQIYGKSASRFAQATRIRAEPTPLPRAIPLRPRGSPQGISRFRALLDAEPARDSGESSSTPSSTIAGFGTYGPFADTPPKAASSRWSSST
jgi:hypothetical protein